MGFINNNTINSDTFNLFVSTVLYNNIKSNLIGVYQQGMENMSKTEGFNNFQSQKEEITLDGRRGYSIKANFNIQDIPGILEGLIVAEDIRMWIIYTVYLKRDEKAKELTNKILNSIRFNF